MAEEKSDHATDGDDQNKGRRSDGDRPHVLVEHDSDDRRGDHSRTDADEQESVAARRAQKLRNARQAAQDYGRSAEYRLFARARCGWCATVWFRLFAGIARPGLGCSLAASPVASDARDHEYFFTLSRASSDGSF
ncbi:hypothetical protein Aab01nite_01460 [Paractinoplanes abujensis]|nr:hypothetical protein Aab01nite_01460 [Actinoplanes abujensis]